MIVFAISGHAQNGKDTTANIIYEILTEHGYKGIIIHYADLLKYLCKQYFHWDGIKDEKGRTILQYVGTDIVRKRNPDYWVDFVCNFIKMFEDEWDFVIIPDTRFPNEVECLKEHGFISKHIRVERPNFDNGLTETQKNHPSETALDNTAPDYAIVNDGTMEDLYIKVKDYLKDFYA